MRSMQSGSITTSPAKSRRGALKGQSFLSAWAGQVREHRGAGNLGLNKRRKGGAADLYGAPTLVVRAPRCQITIASAEAGTAASFKADHEGEAVACRTPDMQVLDGTADAVELHDNPTRAPIRRKQHFADSENAVLLT